MHDPAVLKKIRALMARAVDPGATEEEQRTSAHVAAKLCREHGIDLGAVAAPTIDASSQRAEVVIGNIRAVVETVNEGLGFDVFEFARGLAVEVFQARLRQAAETMRNPPPQTSKRPMAKKRKR